MAKSKWTDEQIQQLARTMQVSNSLVNNNPKIHYQYCGSTNVKKINADSRLVSVCTMGIAGNKIGETMVL